jgi:hypothetical protein
VHKSRVEPGRVIRATNDQIKEIVAHRHQIHLHCEEFERLKRRYVSRPGDGKPATRFELLREVVKGKRGPAGQSGTPSEYQPTGLRFLLDKKEMRST